MRKKKKNYSERHIVYRKIFRTCELGFLVQHGKCPTTSLFLPPHCPGLENVTAHCVCSPFLEREGEKERESEAENVEDRKR